MAQTHAPAAPVPQQSPRHRSSWLFTLLLTGLFLLVGVIYWAVGSALFRHAGGGSLAVSPLWDFAGELGLSGYSICTSTIPLIFVAFLLIQNRRLLPLAYSALGIALLQLFTTVYAFFRADTPAFSPASDFLNILFTTINVASSTLTLSALILLPALPPRYARIRMIAVAFLFLLFFLNPLTEFNGQIFTSAILNDICVFLQLLALALLLPLIPIVAYFNLRHRVTFPGPPADVAPSIYLTCPRCNTGQTMPSAGGHCQNCRLHIAIITAESFCPQCSYPLRDLPSDRCPECGTQLSPIAKTT